MKRDYCYEDGEIVYYEDGSVKYREEIYVKSPSADYDLDSCLLCSKESDKYVRRENGLNMPLCKEHIKKEEITDENLIDIDLYIRNEKWFDMYD